MADDASHLYCGGPGLWLDKRTAAARMGFKCPPEEVECATLLKFQRHHKLLLVSHPGLPAFCAEPLPSPWLPCPVRTRWLSGCAFGRSAWPVGAPALAVHPRVRVGVSGGSQGPGLTTNSTCRRERRFAAHTAFPEFPPPSDSGTAPPGWLPRQECRHRGGGRWLTSFLQTPS